MEKEIEKRLKEVLEGSDIAERNIKAKAKKDLKKLDIIIKKQQKIIDNLRIEKKRWKRDWYAGAYNRYKKEIKELKQIIIGLKKQLDFNDKAIAHLIKLYNKETKK